RTSGLYVPNVALYQAKLHSDDPLTNCLSEKLLLHRLLRYNQRLQRTRIMEQICGLGNYLFIV
ncbi:hypothetical protein, partial [Chromobacterium violaceum]|uniref:hypothetical protein n=1 Tax=Chromobacterium violaceum TaxID=536 RepID=UPI001A973BEC